jgi:hypothetical protein
LSYRRAYHEAIRAWVEGRVGAADADPVDEAPSSTSNGVAVWTLPDGRLLMRDDALEPEDEPALMWLSHAVVAMPRGEPGS